MVVDVEESNVPMLSGCALSNRGEGSLSLPNVSSCAMSLGLVGYGAERWIEARLTNSVMVKAEAADLNEVCTSRTLVSMSCCFGGSGDKVKQVGEISDIVTLVSE
jgi:hypothetical protein